jgi:ABC-type multidrug transport system ATPase subunit
VVTKDTQVENKKSPGETERSLPWLEIESSSTGDDDEGSEHYVLQCRDKANDHIRGITEPLNLLSIMGPTRSGKSTLMNLLAGCKTKELFNTAPGSKSFTKGILTVAPRFA